MDQQQDGGQKRICFRNEQQQEAGAEPLQQAPALQPQATAPLRDTGQDDPGNPGPLCAGLKPKKTLSAGSGWEGQLQGAVRGARAAPAEPTGGAQSPAL